MRSEVSFADACSLIVDCPHKTAPESADAYAYAVGTKAVSEGRINFAAARPVDESTYRTWIARAAPNEGDIILCREAPVGPAARVPASRRVCLGQRTVLIRANPEIADSAYLLYALLAPATQDALRAMSEGSTVPHLNVADVRRFPLQLPELDEQERIASILSALDDKIDSNRRLSQLLDDTAAAYFHARFVDFIGEDGLTHVDGRILPRNGWRMARIDAIADINAASHSRRTHPAEIDYVDISSVSPRSIDEVKRLSYENAPSRARRVVRSGDTIISTVRPERRSMAFVHQASSAMTASTGFAVVSPTRAAPTFVYRSVTHPSCIEYLSQCATGSAYPAVNPSVLGGWQVPVPPDRGQAFEDFSRPLELKRHLLAQEAATLQSVRDQLLPKLMSEEIRALDSADPDEVIGPAADLTAA